MPFWSKHVRQSFDGFSTCGATSTIGPCASLSGLDAQHAMPSSRKPHPLLQYILHHAQQACAYYFSFSGSAISWLDMGIALLLSSTHLASKSFLFRLTTHRDELEIQKTRSLLSRSKILVALITV